MADDDDDVGGLAVNKIQFEAPFLSTFFSS